MLFNLGMNSWMTTSGGFTRLAKETGFDAGGMEILDERKAAKILTLGGISICGKLFMDRP